MLLYRPRCHRPDCGVKTTIQCAAEVLKAGGVVLHATEGIWGLACDPWSASAVEEILSIKQRPAEKGLIVIGAKATDFAPQLAGVDAAARKQIVASWPGRHTWILPDVTYPEVVRGFRETLACRVPGHAQARALCTQFGGTLVSTSANVTGVPAITQAAEARQQFAALVDYLLPGEVGKVGTASVIHGLDGAILR